MWGKNQLEISWGSIFAVGHFHSSWGKTQAPDSYCQPCIMHTIMDLNFDWGGGGGEETLISVYCWYHLYQQIANKNM